MTKPTAREIVAEMLVYESEAPTSQNIPVSNSLGGWTQANYSAWKALEAVLDLPKKDIPYWGEHTYEIEMGWNKALDAIHSAINKALGVAND